MLTLTSNVGAASTSTTTTTTTTTTATATTKSYFVEDLSLGKLLKQTQLIVDARRLELGNS